MTTLRCVTIKQPWAFATVIDHPDRKTIENRSRGAIGWKHLGLTVVHAGLGWSERGAQDPRITELLGGVPERDDPRLVYGAAIGVFDLADVHVASGCCKPWGEQEYRQADGSMVRQVTHLALEDMVRLERPVSCKGKLGLWFPPRPVEAAIEQQLWASTRSATQGEQQHA